jgi:uncharacterized protein
MPALRKSLKHRTLWIFLAVATVLAAAAAISDWGKPAYAQTSVQFYNRWIVAGYWRNVRPVTSHFIRCRFQPTCSVYSLTAMQTYGFPKGLWLTVKRICRCQPWVRIGTYDPVPVPPSQPVPGVVRPGPDHSRKKFTPLPHG